MTGRSFLRVGWPAAAMLIVLMAIGLIAALLLASLPPRHIVMATGSEGGTYYEVGKRYQDGDAGCQAHHPAHPHLPRGLSGSAISSAAL